MVDFSKLKKNRANDLEKLSKAIETLKSGSASNDERFWQAEMDKEGNATAVIRFLPAPPQDGDDGLPWAKYWNHGFKHNGSWYIENCPTTLGKECPVCQDNDRLWNKVGTKESKAIVSERKRKLHYVSNIYVVKDKKHPENEGKVFLFRYGSKIFDKIDALMHPDTENTGQKPVVPFDLWSGANFVLKIKKEKGYANFDDSSFAMPGELHEDDSVLEKIYKSEYSLAEFASPESIKPFDDLKSRFDKVTGTPSTKPTTVETAREVTREVVDEEDSGRFGDVTENDDDDDVLKKFKQLIDEE